MEKDMRNKPQLNPAQLITADLWIDFFAQHFNVPPQNVAFAKSVIRIDDFWALRDAVNSGLKVSASVVDRAVECIEKANEAQIEVSDLSYEEKEVQRQKNHTIAECIKIAIKRRLRAEGRLTQ
ncbi:MAG: hypothetical protein PUJ41_02225 [Bacteroidales bacterium]|nr:hypothetical protein [Bacteroidales bacterium]MDY4141870.1 hypothetical protein [Sodaliphilus sp.]